jgi:hypothetical protein
MQISANWWKPSSCDWRTTDARPLKQQRAIRHEETREHACEAFRGAETEDEAIHHQG